nr:hypothetical protein [uncultured Actinotalea sp.]
MVTHDGTVGERQAPHAGRVRTARPPVTARRRVAVLIAWVVAFAGLGSATGPAAAAAEFDAGYIVSDELFRASWSMSAEDVQRFLNEKGARCVPGPDGTPCLKDYRQTTPDKPADTRCTGRYVGAVDEPAARIIAKVAAACGISPKVLLVLLQKEQGLVTASGAALTPIRYRSATGYGCPDTAPCDAQYYGFFNQVYQAAWRFRDYALAPERFRHRAGQWNDIRYHPDPACGSAPVFVVNQATAGLYNYTPYQPNAAALASAGTGDACSSYGNRNFWRFYTQWFGSPTGRAPIGVVEQVAATNTTITVSGWTLDPDAMESNDVHVYVDGRGTAATADLSRPDVAAVHGLGDRHGFSVAIPADPGPRSVCVYGISYGLGENALLGCTTVTVPDVAPVGSVETVTVRGTTLTVSGWTVDPDTTDPTDVHIYVDGKGIGIRADLPRPDVAAALGRGDRHGFTWSTTLTDGPHTVCVYAINTVRGPNTPLTCTTVTSPGPDSVPVGALDTVQSRGDVLTVTGWSFDPDTTAPNDVHIYVDGVGARVLADLPRPDVGRAFGNGDLHGYTYSRTVSPGRHDVCAYGINTAAGKPNTLLGCRTVVVADSAPIGALDAATVSGSTLTASGWTFDPDTDASIDVHVYVNATGVSLRADQSRPDVAAVFRRGDKHGWTYRTDLTPGSYSVCAYGINTAPGGAHTLLGCRQVQVAANAAPIGAVDAVTATAGEVTVSGWALDPDTTASTSVHVYVDGVGTALLADQPRPDVAAVFGRGELHGFTARLAAPAGQRTACVYAIDTRGGPPSLLGCRPVVVP